MKEVGKRINYSIVGKHNAGRCDDCANRALKSLNTVRSMRKKQDMMLKLRKEKVDFDLIDPSIF